MIRVLFTIPNFDTAGSGRVLLSIATRLDPAHFEPHIMCKHDRGEFFQTVRDTGLPLHVFRYETPMRPVLSGMRGCWQVSRKLRQIAPDIIHSFHYGSDYSEALAARLAGCKWVYTKKNMMWGGSSANGWKLRTKLADAIVTVNSDMKEKFFPGSDKVTFIPPSVDTSFFRDDSPLKSESDASIVVCVANFAPVKAIEVLVEAFKVSLRRVKECWRLKIVGDYDTDYGNDMRQQYKEMLEAGVLEFTGKRSDVRPELASSSIFVMPSRMEGSPVSLLEAMSTGLPVIGSRIPGIIDQLAPMGNDYLFEAGNVNDLAEKLERLMLLGYSDRKELGRSFRDYCRENWDISVEVARHEELYHLVSGNA